MRRPAGLSIPLFFITLYYGIFISFVAAIQMWLPWLADYLPLGGIENLLLSNAGNRFEAISGTDIELYSPESAVQLALAVMGTMVLMVPTSWVYIITTRYQDIEQAFVQTIMVLPVVVAGIAMIVQHSLALAFSLAGVVAAVRFRFTLDKPSQALYVFAAIGIGLGSGIGALGVSTVISMSFAYASLVLWKLEYGGNVTSPFMSLLSGRDKDDRE